MSQRNYFAYNIIDALYYNKPTGSELTTVYGVDNKFVRRTDDSFKDLTPEELEKYDDKEKEFIQAVINKYIMDNFGDGTGFDEHSSSTSYIGVHFRKGGDIGIELGDMISTINGTHNYKLMSAKDIDFDNVTLPNSKIDNEYNWGEFDKGRRWGNKPVTINNTFELLNVIDYLLYACNNLWNELYKIKYNSNDYVQIWFTKNVANNSEIRYTNHLSVDNMRIGSDPGDYITYLDPRTYYASLNNINENNKFGFVTNFYLVDGENANDKECNRKISDVGNKNIILMDLTPMSKYFSDYRHTTSTSQNINGDLQNIYGYLIGNELKIYPGSRINAFLDSSNQYTNSNLLIDFINKKLTKEVFFRTSKEPGNDIFSKVYIKFLDIDNITKELDPYEELDLQNPYFLYYIDNDNKKHILTCNYQGATERNDIDLMNFVRNKISGDYIFESFNMINLDDSLNDEQKNEIKDQYNEAQIDKITLLPIYYAIPNEFFTSLEISTPNSTLFSATTEKIILYYYKSNNTLNCSVSRKEDNLSIDINPLYDRTQNDSIAYHDFRYNIPAGETSYFKFDAKYIALNNENPLNIKLDDEYKDILFYCDDNTPDNIYSSYYQFDDIDKTSNNSLSSFRRIFKQYDNNENFKTQYNLSLGIDNGGNNIVENYKHRWIKDENPYKLNVRIENDEFVIQQANKDEVDQEIANIVSNNELQQISYNEYQFNHSLPDNIEQIKMNFVFNIDATSKVNEISYVIPVNLNKVYKPTINYFSKIALEKEREDYQSIIFNVYNAGDPDVVTHTIPASKMYEHMYNKYGEGPNGKLNKLKDIYSYLSNEPIKSLDDFKLRTTYDSTYNNCIFEITYNPMYNFVNLIGSWYTSNLINNMSNDINSPEMYNHKFAKIAIKKTNNDNTSTTTQLNAQNEQAPYIFNINGFGFNYRLHGSNGTVNGAFENINDPELSRIQRYYEQYDLLSIATPSNEAINGELCIKLSDGEETSYQLSYISMNKKDIWEKNEGKFYAGMNIESTEEDDNYNYDDSENNNSNNYNTYLLSSVPVNIYKQSYLVNCDTIFTGMNLSDNAISYYVSLAYMEIKSSTVFPPLEYNPTSYMYDLNNNVDAEKYKNYVKWWDSNEDNDNLYRPITMSMKLVENIDKANPFYYESNEAVMKFNIKRITDNNSSIPVTGENLIYLGLNSYYYLSDFINVGISNNSNNSKPTGSYMYYDKDYNMYMIHEIYDNSIKDISNVTNVFNPTIGNASDNVKIPYPIFKQSKTENDVLVFDNDKYDFNIYRISDINKLKLGNNSIIKETVVPSGNNEYTSIRNDNETVGLEINKDLFYVKINNDFINNFCVGSNKTFNIIGLTVIPTSILSSKNYTGASMSTTGSFTKIAPIIREQPSYKIDYQENNNTTNIDIISLLNNKFNKNLSADVISDYISRLKNMYLTRTYEYNENNIDYEFFEYKYDNICKIQIFIDSANSSANYVYKQSLSPTNNYMNIQEAYDDQLSTFLDGVKVIKDQTQTTISFICTDTEYDRIFRQFSNDNSNITIN